MQNREILETVPLLRELEESTREYLARQGRIRLCGRGQLIYRAKEPVERVCFQLEGKSMLYNVTHSGNRKIIFILGFGELLNDHVLNEHETSLFCEAVEAGQVLEFPVSVFTEAMKKDFLLTRRILAAQERKIWRLGHQLKNTMGSIYLERKLAAKLWKLSRDFGVPGKRGLEIDIHMTVTFLADLLGAPRETTSRVCKTLAEHGLIRMEKKRICIPDRERMARFYKTGRYE